MTNRILEVISKWDQLEKLEKEKKELGYNLTQVVEVEKVVVHLNLLELNFQKHQIGTIFFKNDYLYIIHIYKYVNRAFVK